jgi:hypothetical protein
MGASVKASVTVISTMTAEIANLAEALEAGFEQHPAAKVVRSLPGLGTILGARVLGEFGDDPNRYATAKCRKNYAGTSPITRASGTKRVVLARYARNHATRRRDLPLGLRRAHLRHREHAPTTTPTGPPATPTTPHSDRSGIGSSASFTAVSPTAASTTSTPPGATGQTTNLRWPLDKLEPWDI